jgi:predicted transcriptional regulator
LTRNNHKIFKLLASQGYPSGKVIAFLLDCEGYSKSKVAFMSGVGNAMVTRTIAGHRGSKKVEDTIKQVLGFNPF